MDRIRYLCAECGGGPGHGSSKKNGMALLLDELRSRPCTLLRNPLGQIKRDDAVGLGGVLMQTRLVAEFCTLARIVIVLSQDPFVGKMGK